MFRTMIRSRAAQQPANHHQAFDVHSPDSPTRPAPRQQRRASTLWRPALAAAALLLLLLWLRRTWLSQPAADVHVLSDPKPRGAAAHAADHARATQLAGAPPSNVIVRLPGPRPLPFPPKQINDALLRAVVDECVKQQETYIYVHGSEASVVSSADFLSSVLSRPCPIVDIMLAAEHRSFGL